MKNRLLINRLFSGVAAFSLLFNTLVAPLTVYADESPAPTPTASPDETSSPTPTPEETIAPTPTDTPTDVPSPTATDVVTTTEVTPTPAATDDVTPPPSVDVQSSVNSDSTPTTAGPPSNSQVSGDSTQAPSMATPTPATTESGTISAVILKDTQAASLGEFDLTVQTDGSATISTDKLDYAPTDSVLVTGSGFIANKTYTIIISSSDDPAVTHSESVNADSQGKIIYSYQLDGNYRPNYKVEVKDGEIVVATTNFTDSNPASVTYCHATPPETAANGWNSNTTSGEAVISDGHDGHGADIIPSFTYQLWEKTGSHQECPTSSSSYGSWANGKTCQKWIGNQWKYAYPVSVDDYGWVNHTYSGKNLNTLFSGVTGQVILDHGCAIPSTGTLRVLKNVDLNGDGDFGEAGETGATNWKWQANSGADHNTGDAAITVNTGDYTLTETAQSGFHFLSLECTGGTLNGNTVTVVKNANVVCTFNNLIDTGTVVVHKDVQGPNGEGVTDTSNTFKVKIDGNNEQNITDNGAVTYSDVLAGTHTITESFVPSGYTLYSITPDSNGGLAGAQITVSKGQTTDVYVVNRQQAATIKVYKDVRKPDGTDTTSDNQSFTVKLNGANSKTISDSESGYATYSVNPGTVNAISEVENSNYVSKGCKLATGGDATNMVLTPGQSINVTCTNWQKTATITVIKNVYAPNGTTDVSDNHSFSVKVDGQTKSFAEGSNAVFTFNPGTYSVTETNDPDYVYMSGNSSITVYSNGSATITIKNKQNFGSIKVCKVIVDAQGHITNGSAMPASTFTINWTGVEGAPNLDPSVFNSGYTLTDKIFSDSDGNDANCINYPNIPIGSYNYSEEAISGAGWETPKYNDQYETKVLDLGDFYEYTSYNGNPDSNGNIDLRNSAGPNRTLVILNQYKTGSVTGYKWNDLNGDADWDKEGDNPESGISGWGIELRKVTGELVASTQTGENGSYSFSYIPAGNYQVCEILQGGWIRKYPVESNCQSVVITAGQTTSGINFGNQAVQLGITLTKSNDKGSGVLASDTISYTLTLTNNGNIPLFNIDVTDALPGGFSYVAGSTTGASEPTVSGGLLTWKIDYLGVAESVTIEYKAVTPSDLADGIYTNLATCNAFTRGQDIKRLTYDGIVETIGCDPVESKVTKGSNQSYGGSLNPQVLGAATELPATGSDTGLVVFAIVALGAGIVLKRKGARKHAKN